MGMVVNNANNKLYVGDRHLISRVSFNVNSPVDGESYTVYELIGNIARGLRDGNKTTSRFNEPRFVAITSDDNWLFVSDSLNYRIRRIDISADKTLVLGNDNPAALAYTSVTYAAFTTGTIPQREHNGIAINAAGNTLFVVSTGLHGVWKIPILAANAYPSPSTGWLFIGDAAKTKAQIVDGISSSARFAAPGACTIDDHDNLYVMDYYDFLYNGML